MRIVIDTNKLFSFFWKGSLIKKLILEGYDLYSPEFALEELENNKGEILRKTGLSRVDFEEFVIKLKKVVKFVPFSQYSERIPEAFNLLPKNPKDVDFLALAIKLNAAIVSNDKGLKKQSRVSIFEDSRLSELI
ncbi:MAG: PIN domain-containing protein [Candidatus Pacearchaeota archaeon]